MRACVHVCVYVGGGVEEGLHEGKRNNRSDEISLIFENVILLKKLKKEKPIKLCSILN